MKKFITTFYEESVQILDNEINDFISRNLDKEIEVGELVIEVRDKVTHYFRTVTITDTKGKLVEYTNRDYYFDILAFFKNCYQKSDDITEKYHITQIVDRITRFLI